MDIFNRLESKVSYYSKKFPTVFEKAYGYRLYDDTGRSFIDFLSGAGALNYGHNNQKLISALVAYISRGGITHSLDMATVAKREFMEVFESTILEPRGLDYKIQFTGPTGTNAVEAALKLARKATGRRKIASFFNSFHGMTLGSLSVSDSRTIQLSPVRYVEDTIFLPFDNPKQNTKFEFYRRPMQATEGVEIVEELPAAIILETVQAEGGVQVAKDCWLREVSDFCRKNGIVMIVDDIQVGCGRTGSFFSFESSGIKPDIVCLSKSLSGLGLPMSILLIDPSLDDVWNPGEHTGTFRGNNFAFVTAKEALSFWSTTELVEQIMESAYLVRGALEEIALMHIEEIGSVRSRGLIQGLVFRSKKVADRVLSNAFMKGLIIESCGPSGEVVKLLPPLTIDRSGLASGLQILQESISAAIHKPPGYFLQKVPGPV